MRNKLLLPHFYRKIGLVLLIPAMVLLVAVFQFDYSIPFLQYGWAAISSPDFDLKNNDLTDEVAVLLAIVSLFFTAFSKEKKEDEYVQEVRLKALQLSVYINYFVLVCGTLFVYGLSYLYILYGNLFTILIIFNIVYYYRVHFANRLKAEPGYEE